MSTRRRIEIFTAGCPACEETVAMIGAAACPSCEVTILDMRDRATAARAKALGVTRVPAVAIDGRLADCCSGGGPDAQTLRRAGLGRPL